MNNQNTLRLALLSLLGLALLAGCAQSTDPLLGEDISGGNEMDAIDLDAEYGAIAYEDEQLAFGDQTLLAEALREDDLALTAAHPDSGFGDAERDFRRIWVRILWGRLDGRPIDDAEREADRYAFVDWSGGVAVDQGVVVLKRTLLFEYPADHPLPRDSRQRLEWVSWAGPHMDGVLLCIGVPADPSVDLSSLSGSLSFETGPLSLSIPLASLAAGVNRVVESSVAGHSVSFLSSSQPPAPCPHGFLAGYWQRVENDEHQGGFFRGRVLNANGRLAGYLAGRFGVNSEGRKVFFGKLIGRDGRIRGLVRGAYGVNDEGLGVFHGAWANRSGELLGELHGSYVARGEGAGFFHGAWAARCRDQI